jgi:hypothetical protein
MDVFFLGYQAVIFGKDKRDFLELGIDAIAVLKFDRVAVHDMTVTANHFDKLSRFRVGLAHIWSSNRNVFPTLRS